MRNGHSLRLTEADLAERAKRLKSSKPSKQAVPHATESQEQRAVVQWWDAYAASRGIDKRLLFMVPNGSVLAGDARRRAIQMDRLKKEGLRVGVPDLVLAIVRAPWPGLFIEMKSHSGVLSEDQKSMIHTLEGESYKCSVCFSADQAIRRITEYLT